MKMCKRVLNHLNESSMRIEEAYQQFQGQIPPPLPTVRKERTLKNLRKISSDHSVENPVLENYGTLWKVFLISASFKNSQQCKSFSTPNSSLIDVFNYNRKSIKIVRILERMESKTYSIYCPSQNWYLDPEQIEF